MLTRLYASQSAELANMQRMQRQLAAQQAAMQQQLREAQMAAQAAQRAVAQVCSCCSLTATLHLSMSLSSQSPDRGPYQLCAGPLARSGIAATCAQHEVWACTRAHRLAAPAPVSAAGMWCLSCRRRPRRQRSSRHGCELRRTSAGRPSRSWRPCRPACLRPTMAAAMLMCG